METAKPSQAGVAIKWALINVITAIVITYIFQFLGTDISAPSRYLAYIPFIAFICLSQIEYRSKLTGFITYGQGFVEGLLFGVFSGIMMAVFISPFTVTRQSINAVIHLSLIGWVSILFLGIFCSGIAYVLWAKSLKELEATKVGSFLYLEPFVTVLSAWFILSETITLTIILSGLIITAGVILVNRK